MNDIRPKQTVCLCIDLKRSTSTGLALSTTKFDQFNLALVRQLGPHLTTVGLEDALVKFTGDGWLIMSDETDMVDRFCCLALIMGHRFRDEIAESAKIDLDKVPPLRIAIGHGRDLPITLPDGSRDYVGDSVRRAVRACQFCHDNEILIDGTTYDWVHHDFEASHVDVPARQEEHPSAKMEEIRTLFRLTALKVESAEESDAPGHLVSTLNILGQGEHGQQHVLPAGCGR